LVYKIQTSGMLRRVDWYIFIKYHLPVDTVQCRRTRIL